MRRLSNLALHGLFGFIAGCIYLLIELAWRGYTHWTMLPLAAIGTIIATALELAAGLVLNVWLGLGIWDYSNLPGNVMGQICPQFTVAWALLMIVSIKLENFMHKIFDIWKNWHAKMDKR